MKSHDGCRAALAAALCLLALSSAPTSALSATDDSPMIKPYPEAKLLKQSIHALESYWIPTGRLFGDGQAEKFEVVEGKWTHFTFANPAKSSVIEIGRRFDEKLRDAGFEIVYDCRDGNCGSGGRKTNGDWWDPTFQRRYLVGKLERSGGDVWICVNVWAKSSSISGQHDVDVIEAKPEPRVERVEPDETDAGWLEHELIESGHVAVRGIGFDDRKSAVTASSERSIQAIAQLLARDPRRKLLLVVHSDGSGDVRGSVARTKKQAALLVTSLVKKHGVAANRILGEGVGPLAPLAPNTAEGSALNRRVEVVLRAGTPDPALKANQSSE
jgi:outer membrane protein OmpA-like peptidoglycan-associated protein